LKKFDSYEFITHIQCKSKKNKLLTNQKLFIQTKFIEYKIPKYIISQKKVLKKIFQKQIQFQ